MLVMIGHEWFIKNCEPVYLFSKLVKDKPIRAAKNLNLVYLMEKSSSRKNPMVILGKELPEVARCFTQLHDTVMADGVLSEKTKELVAVGISVAIRCSPCIQNHVPMALKTGSSPAEISEAVAVGLMMRGGPAVGYASEAIELLNSLSKEKKEKQL
jgi:AhpD family alkylhydroperoxidase